MLSVAILAYSPKLPQLSRCLKAAGFTRLSSVGKRVPLGVDGSDWRKSVRSSRWVMLSHGLGSVGHPLTQGLTQRRCSPT
eukprot:4211869-Amphidinium_carterae.1